MSNAPQAVRREDTRLHTNRLLLRPFELGDVDDALVYRNDQEFARFLPHIAQPFTQADAEQFVRQNMSEPWEQYATFAVVVDGHVIGTVNLDMDDASRTSAMIGYAIARDQWGEGIAAEAAATVMAWGFDARNLQRIWASTEARHLRSLRVMEKLGMQRQAVLPAHTLARDGQLVDEVVCAVSREAWNAR